MPDTMQPNNVLPEKDAQISKSVKHDVRADADDDDELLCGYYDWNPRWLQRLATPRWLLACLSWFTFTQGFVVNGIVYVNLSPWERLYELQSSQTAWIVSTYDVSAGNNCVVRRCES